jgi:uroporphyrinogen-III decarboxylase
MVKAIHQHGGFARLHSHGNLHDILDDIVATGCMGLDPVEPPPQGDVSLAYVRERYGEQLVLFGNLEANDLENESTSVFEKRIRTALNEGTGGKGFVLMPSAAPYGRTLTPNVVPNYEAMIRLAEEAAG